MTDSMQTVQTSTDQTGTGQMGAGEVLATAKASPARRGVGLLSLAGLGVMLIYSAFTRSPDLGWQIALGLIGLGFIAIAEVMRRSTASALELTDQGLRDADGRVIVHLDEIERIDQGAFAVKPSNGFLLKTNRRVPRGWRLGLWWSLGRRIGVGGMTPANETKLIAEIIRAKLAERHIV
ncbi:hypothetical protein DSM110093_02152 [Sulfitobacter sp. DSM 110093]|uniref:hypothetical protein n=1 Tax=Sulfitobacter sp. DSM 110093 TaxID=2883127 RepID=UPI001FACBE68|nr:hypothetical protein [Sulfitobacter sp. DSM 110093]UOA32360.1 hypothetical protein DSM110093_02152 [Sulfitobacter sp. DSM 110093]